ncbi:MAG TPA: hypothetical protein DC049_16545, partial [Spirochaetia bacterium]|nr:hypothetical protein [Spirochaetia bacterium]
MLKIFLTTPGNEQIDIRNKKIVRLPGRVQPVTHANFGLLVLASALSAFRVKILDAWAMNLSNDQ